MIQIETEVVDKTVNVKLPPTLDIPSCEALRESVLSNLAPGMALRLDSERVEQLTTPGVQMLLAVAECAGRKETAFKIAHPSEALIEAFKDAGLFSTLMAWDLE